LRKAKVIGASLEAKLLLYPTDPELRQHLQALNPGAGDPTNQVDELRYIFLTSQVELLENAEPVQALKPEYQFTYGEELQGGVALADGHKCDRCWNYSVHVGEHPDHLLLCERCVPAVG
jgi:isoleucyl-tRNA synthetase